MATQEAAQSVPVKFWHGRQSMVAPHLPVGSPERDALFKELGRTFVEDWKAAEDAVARDTIIAKGDLYFIRCGDAVKIGRTVNIVERLRTMQTDNHMEVDCLLLLKGQGHNEPKWHKRFKAHRLRGEWFRWCQAIKTAIDLERNLNMQRSNA